MIYAAIDPGLTGGIAILHENGKLELHEIPLLVKGIIDYDALADIFRYISNQDHFLIMEDVHAIPGAGAKQSFNFGQVVGAKKALLSAFRIKHAMVQPKTWQKLAWTGVPNIQKSTGGNDTKAMSLVAATRIFPDKKFLKSKDGLIDAALIAFYNKTTYGK